jgi:ribosomal protein S18 acetylase RimI-like enzyme
MIKLKELINIELDGIAKDVDNFEKYIVQKYKQYLEQFHAYYDADNNSIYLTDIYILPQFRSKGWGQKIMRELIAFADAKKLPVVLIPVAESFNNKARSRLIKFYKMFGFIENRGNSKFDDMSMYRLPK